MTVSEQIIQVIDALCEKFGIAINWTSENVIPYIKTLCEKLIAYEIGTSIAWMVIMISFSIGSIVITKKVLPYFEEGLDEYYNEWWMAGAVFGIVGLIGLNLATIIVVGTQIMDIIKCVTCPEMYIFEYVKSLI